MSIKNFIQELQWRGQFNNATTNIENLDNTSAPLTAYIGFDPTSDSLHVGSLAQIITLMRFQKAGHKPIALIGGATGMIGDPSGKKEERKLLTEEEVQYNAECIQKQLKKIFNSDEKDEKIEILNNIDWTKNLSIIEFLRDIGKRFSINYMLAKDSVKSRIESEMSFTEFTYQLLQAYDFLWLYENKNCVLQMGGSDQWGNITTGIELIRKKLSKEAHAITTNLITKADGTKFGKTENGNIWLDRNKTSPYKFYQFWLNTSDEDAKSYIKIFTFLSKDEIDTLIEKHLQVPHERLLQKTLAKELTTLVHSKQDFEYVQKASDILFNGSINELAALPENVFNEIMEGVPVSYLDSSTIQNGLNIVDFLTIHTNILPSKSEARKMIQANALYINKEKVSDTNFIITPLHIINKKFILIQKGKKNYYLCKIKY